MFFSNSVTFNQDKDIPSLAGKVILVTGGNIGLGKQCVLDFAKHKPAQIWLAARNLDKARATTEEIKKQVPEAPIKLLELDLASVESVKKAAATVASESDRLDILMLNAAVMACPPSLTEDGYELQFGTNYVGHVLLFKLLIPVLDRTATRPDADVRIVALSSMGHSFAPKDGIPLDTMRTPAENLGPWVLYGISKLAAIHWARQASKVYPQFTIVSVHPGVVHTNIWAGATGTSGWLRVLGYLYVNSGLANTVDIGVRSQLWAATAKGVKSGEYYEPIGVTGKATTNGKSDEQAEKLWEWTETELQKYTL